MTEAQPIERVHDISPGAFASEFEAAQRPCVLVGGASTWRATRSWSAPYLKERLGHVPVQFKVSTRHTHPNFDESTLAKMFARESGTLAAFLDAITFGPRDERATRLFTGDEQFVLQHRSGRTTVNENLRLLLDDVEIPAPVPDDRLYTVWAWFSGPGVRTWLHYDNNACHNFNAQLTGRKSCRLFAPNELAKMYPFPLGGANPAHNCSQVDIERPDLERFPLFAEAVSCQAELEPGDLLFIPAWWFHSFLHLGELNSNMNFWWKPAAPVCNDVAARQLLLDWAAAAKASLAQASTATEALQALDQAATAPRA